jgi:hypothetical protein
MTETGSFPVGFAQAAAEAETEILEQLYFQLGIRVAQGAI